MRRFLVALFCLLSFKTVYSQSVVLSQEHKSLIDAEWAFINLAREKNTRDAFLANVTNETRVYDKGKMVDAKKHYEAMTPAGHLLSWAPEYTDISGAGDIGYNTGPWNFRRNKDDATAVAYGHFISVWKKHADGTWKLAVDLGISHAPDTTPYVLTKSQIPTSLKRDKNVSDIRSIERLFIDKVNMDAVSAYRSYLSSEGRVYRTGYMPATAFPDVARLVENDAEVKYEILGTDLSFSGDFGFAYGTATLSSNGQIKTFGYLRIWKLETGRTWRIIADVLTNG